MKHVYLPTLLFGMILGFILTTPVSDGAYTVQQVCDQASREYGGMSEQLCADLQDFYNVTYKGGK